MIYCDGIKHGGDYGGHVQMGKRPFLIIQNNKGNEHAPTLIVAPLTKRCKKVGLPTHVLIDKSLINSRFHSVVLLEQIATIDKPEEFQTWGHLPPNKMREVNLALISSILED